MIYKYVEFDPRKDIGRDVAARGRRQSLKRGKRKKEGEKKKKIISTKRSKTN